MKTDLFPETLLVTIRDGHTETDSLKVAQHFHKQHKNVIQSIENLIAEVEKLGGHRLNFQPMFYQDRAGQGASRQQKMYRMDRLAFSVLVSRFTGTKALAWQLDYHRQFEQMERRLLDQEMRFARALDQISPALRPVVEGTERSLSRQAIGAGIGKSCNSVSYYRARAKRLQLLPTR